jgi:hypothetical protein
VPLREVFWGTTGCSLRVAIPNRSPLSVGWVFPPGPPRWMGLTDVTLGFYEDSNGLQLSPAGHAALAAFIKKLEGLPGSVQPKPGAIRGRAFSPSAVTTNLVEIEDAIRAVSSDLTQT